MTNINHHLLLPVEATEVKSRSQLASNIFFLKLHIPAFKRSVQKLQLPLGEK